MAFEVEQIRTTAQRVAASHGLDVVDLEFHGGAKHRILRVFIEKNAEERKRLAADFEAGANVGTDPKPHGAAGLDQLAGVTHTDCEAFSRDFGTVLDVEDLIPGADYTLEVSSPGLDRKLHGVEDFRRFHGMLVKVQTFEPVAGNRHWQGRIAEVRATAVQLAVSVKSAGRGKKSAEGRARTSSTAAASEVEISLSNIEKAQLVPEI
jgi:ribosome maturation factor RimP